jgi:hypothetical protein
MFVSKAVFMATLSLFASAQAMPIVEFYGRGQDIYSKEESFYSKIKQVTCLTSFL